MNEPVLVTDAWTNKALSVVRSLGLEGYTVHTSGHKRLGAAMYSTFVKKRFFLPDPIQHPDLYFRKLNELIEQEKYQFILPLEESTMLILFRHKTLLRPQTKLLLPEEKSFRLANDKMEVILLARKLGIPLPETTFSETLQAEKIKAEFKFPLILKPRTSSGSRGIRKVVDYSKLSQEFNKVAEKYGPPLIQEYIPGKSLGLGVGLLAEKGKCIWLYSYKRLREFPVNGGPGTLREITHHPEIKKYAADLIQALNWTGPAMVEFKMDPRDQVPKLMEINPRIWGSIELARAGGLNFPDAMLKMTAGIPIKSMEAKKGTRSRWLFPGDIAHFIFNPERFSLRPSFFNFWGENKNVDEIKSFDKMGSMASIICSLLSIFDPETWRLGIFRK